MAVNSNAAPAAAGRKASADLAGSIEETRLGIIRLTERRYDVEHRPVSEAEAIDRLSQWTDGLRAAAVARFSPDRFMGRAFHAPRPADALEMVLGVLAERIHDDFAAQISAVYAAQPGLSAVDRAAELEAIDESLFALELAEEAMIRSAERSGFNILRRADADPRAVLAHDEVLP